MSETGISKAETRAQRGRPIRPRIRPLATGFTLLEILVVVVIIGVVITFASLSIGGRSLDDRLDAEARRLHELIALAAEEAVLQGAELGFVQTVDGYAFLSFKDGQWLPLEDAGPLRGRAVAEPFYLRLAIEGRAVPPLDTANEKVELKPQVLLLSSGEATAFSLGVHARQFRVYYQLEGDALGRFRLERKEAS